MRYCFFYTIDVFFFQNLEEDFMCVCSIHCRMFDSVPIMHTISILQSICGWDDNACLGVRYYSSIGAWPNSRERRPPWYCNSVFSVTNKHKKWVFCCSYQRVLSGKNQPFATNVGLYLMSTMSSKKIEQNGKKLMCGWNMFAGNAIPAQERKKRI